VKLASPELRDRLASEFVLGTLRGPARRRFQEYLKRDAALRADVARWEAHLTPLADHLPEVDPPARVWSRIEAQLDRSGGTKSAAATTGFWGSIGFWRTLGLGASGLAAVLLFSMLTVKPVPLDQEPVLTAVLAEDNNDARIYIEQPKSNLLTVKMVKPWKANGGIAHELWVIPKDGAPRSLGVISGTSDTTINVAGLDARLANGALFAVSLEPPGGSTSGAPTGKVVCKGSIAWMPPKTARPNSQI